MINRQLIIIVSLAVTLSVVIVWFVVIDNYVIPSQQQQMFDTYQNGYNQGMTDSIKQLFQGTANCQQPTSIWIGNNTKQLIDVACLQIIPNDSAISNEGIGTSP